MPEVHLKGYLILLKKHVISPKEKLVNSLPVACRINTPPASVITFAVVNGPWQIQAVLSSFKYLVKTLHMEILAQKLKGGWRVEPRVLGTSKYEGN